MFEVCYSVDVSVPNDEVLLLYSAITALENGLDIKTAWKNSLDDRKRPWSSKTALENGLDDVIWRYI